VSRAKCSLQRHFKCQRTRDQGPRTKDQTEVESSCRVAVVYSIFSNARGPRTKDQIEVESKSILQHHFKCQTALTLHLLSTSVWSLAPGPLAFEMMLQTTLALHFSLVLSPWSALILLYNTNLAAIVLCS
jgi:hypothetical protein